MASECWFLLIADHWGSCPGLSPREPEPGGGPAEPDEVGSEWRLVPATLPHAQRGRHVVCAPHPLSFMFYE